MDDDFKDSIADLLISIAEELEASADRLEGIGLEPRASTARRALQEATRIARGAARGCITEGDES